jgi:hypothetical protein
MLQKPDIICVICLVIRWRGSGTVNGTAFDEVAMKKEERDGAAAGGDVAEGTKVSRLDLEIDGGREGQAAWGSTAGQTRRVRHHY